MPSLSSSRTVVLLGKENVGKTQLAASLAESPCEPSNLRGTTVSCETYRAGEWDLVDTPGLLRRSDADAATELLGRGDDDATVLLVAQGTDLDTDLADLLPLAAGRRGALAVTFSDRLSGRIVLEKLKCFSRLSGLPTLAVDARRIDERDRRRLFEALESPGPIPSEAGMRFADLSIRPRRLPLERSRLAPLLALLLLIAPAWVAVDAANTLAGWVDPWIAQTVAPAASFLRGLPQPFAEIFAGDYGFVTMGPLLLAWAAPVVVLHALLMGAYKASGLLDRLTVAMDPWLKPFGMTGRELARVVMGFGCNVPAVINTRSSSACSRGVCVSTIAFGSACSYQLGATLAVFAAAGKPALVVPYLLYLGATTLAYARAVAPKVARSPFNLLLTEGRVFLTFPRPVAVWREARGVLREFVSRALPIFFVITAVASLLNLFGALHGTASLIEPLVALFRLPPEATPAIVLAGVRKDGILLLAEPELLAKLSSVQLLTAVYLAGVLVPCLVTCLTIAREQGRRFAAVLIARQALAAAAFSALLAWGGAWL